MKRRRGTGAAVFAAWLVLASWPAAAAELFAGRIEAGTPPSHVMGGPDAVGGLGDWVLGNGVVCATLSSPDHEGVLSASGGVLMDLGHCGRRDDQWSVLHPMLNLSRDAVLSVEAVRAEVLEDEARIVTTATADGLAFETIYSVAPAPSTRLRMETRVERTSPGESFFLLGEVTLHGTRQVTPFGLAALSPGQSVGFRHPEVRVDSPLAMSEAMIRADLLVLVGDPDMGPGISYGWHFKQGYVERADGSADPVAHLSINGEQFSILGSYADSLWFGGGPEPSLLELGQTLLMDLEVGERLVQIREIWLGQEADVASVTDQLWAEGPRVSGNVGRAGVALHVAGAGGEPLTFTRSGSDGAFAFRLPPGAEGDFALDVVAPTGERVPGTFRVEPGESEVALPAPALAVSGRVALPRGQAMRLVFRGQAPTPDPVFGSDGTGFTLGGLARPRSLAASTVSLAGRAGDPVEVEVPPGRYTVFATRGLEWGVTEAEIDVAAGELVTLDLAAPEQQVSWPGWVSADLHVHSGLSDDSALPEADRIRSFVAEAADVMVVTEHDQLADYQSSIEAQGLAAHLVAVPGVELTSTAPTPVVPSTAGHANAFPLEWAPQQYRNGAPSAENKRLREMLTEFAARPSPPLVQLNHPREGDFDSGFGAYFSHLSQGTEGLDPTLPLSDPQHRSLIEPLQPGGLRDVDFAAIELLNGPSMVRYRRTRADWFSLLLQGEVKSATANSDSHTLREIVALPRNYVVYEGAALPAFEVDRFVEAVQQGQMFGTSGPLLDVRLGEAGPGELFEGEAGDLVVRVEAADWVPVQELRVFVNGALFDRRAMEPNSERVVALRFDADSFVTVEVEGKAEPGSVYSHVAPDFTPFAFTNAIRVDADGNGRWEPPGLASPLPETLTHPLQSP